jgi:adenylylsulfate reductase, subunit B
MPPVIDKDICVACGMCVNICPQDVFFGSKKKQTPTVAYPDECWHCNACVLDCPKEGAVRLRIPAPKMIIHKKKNDLFRR